MVAQRLHPAHGAGEGVALLLQALVLGLLACACLCGLGLAPLQRFAQRGQILQATRLHSRPRSAKEMTVPWPTTR